MAHDLHRRGRVVRASNGLTAMLSGSCGSWREARAWRLAPSVLGLFIAQCSSVTICWSCLQFQSKANIQASCRRAFVASSLVSTVHLLPWSASVCESLNEQGRVRERGTRVPGQRQQVASEPVKPGGSHGR